VADTITAYTDGSCLGNPGPGGWAAVLLWNDHRKELTGGFRLTTNNRMEILAAVEALSALKRPTRIELHTDSRYLCDAVEKGWLTNWQRNGWKTSGKQPVKNKDLWMRLIPLLKTNQVVFHWVRGHSGHPENERCDVLAKEAASGGNLTEDLGMDQT
jgi:ribonuclease HI